MTVLEKMNELVGSNATKELIKRWAYANRITVACIAEEVEFKALSNTVDKFIEKGDYLSIDNEHEAWERFLNLEYIE